jgi:hypothetical protein
LATFFVFVHRIVSLGPSGCCLVDVAKDDFLYVAGHGHILGWARREILLEFGDYLVGKAVGEDDVEADVEVAGLVVTIGWHASFVDGFKHAYESQHTPLGQPHRRLQRWPVKRTWFDDLSAWDLDLEDPVVEMLDEERPSSDGREQIDVLLGKQIVPPSFKSIVGLLVNHNDHISRLYSRRLIGLSVKLDGLAVLHPLVDMNFEHLALSDDLLALTRLAPTLGLDLLPFSIAIGASLLDLLHHGSELSRDHFYTATLTRRTRLNSAFFSALATALCAYDRSLECEFDHFALVEVFE